MTVRRFIQCDVFTSVPTKGNGLAVVVDGEGLSDQAMQGFAAWTNLAETTFLVPPTVAEADYKVRIFSPTRELPFAGHPTLGSCASWLQAGNVPKSAGVVRQECGVGIVDIDVSADVPAFAAPATAIEPLDQASLQKILSALGLPADHVKSTARLANGPAWQVLELESADDVLAVDATKVRYPEFVGVGLIGPHPSGSQFDYEVRHIGPSSGMSEDPITGSLNAAIAKWKYALGDWDRPVMISQGTRLGRQGLVSIRYDKSTETAWIGGQTCILITGNVDL